MFWVTILLAVLIGITLGALGGGGSILTVPLLVYVTGLDAKEAIATSLIVVAVTSVFALLPHARARRVRWRTGAIFGLTAMAGAFLGGRVAGFVPGWVLLTCFAVLMLANAIAMLRHKRDHATVERRELPLGMVILEGTVVGFITGFVGAGGGFIVVPALVLLGGLPMPVAVGTSLLVIAMNSLAGFLGHLSSATIDWPLAAAVTAAAVVGSLIGGQLAGWLPAPLLRKAFGWLVLVMGIFVLSQQLL